MKPIVKALTSADEKAREDAEKALDELGRKGLTEAEGRYALRAAARPFPPGKTEWRDASAELVTAASHEPYESYVDVIEGLFSSYSPRAQEAALLVLGSIETRRAADVFVASLGRCSDSTAPSEFRGLAESPRDAEILFPSLLEHLSRPKLRWPVLHLTLSYLEAGELREAGLRDKVCAAVAPLHAELRPSVLARQRATGTSWAWDEEYKDTRSFAALVLDVLGHLGAACAEPELRRALEYRDPKLLQFTVLGLLRSRRAVPSEAILRVAESPESRNGLFRGLHDIGRESLFPPALRTQRAFAESDMVQWLTFPTELGRAPDEIELMAVIPSETVDGPREHYVFRFRTFPPHWAADNGWIVGVAGPFLVKNGPTTEGQGDTFSTFAAWDSRSAEEQLRAVIAPVEETRRRGEKER